MKRALVSSLLRQKVLSFNGVRQQSTPAAALVSCNALKPSRECLFDIADTRLTELPNGFKVASEDNGSTSATVGVWVQSGCKDENLDNNGVSNLLEHVIFKGTGKRDAAQFEKEVTKLGAQLGIHTGREHTAIYARCLSKDVEKVVELLADVVLHAKINNEDVEKEKAVILQQVKDADANKQGAVMDLLHKAAFQGTPLANALLGPIDVLMELSAKDVQQFVKDNYKASRMCLVGAGGVDHRLLEDLGNKYFADVSNNYSNLMPHSGNPSRFTGSELIFDDYSQPMSYGAVAVEGVGWNHPDRVVLDVAASMVGSWRWAESFGPYNAYPLARAVGWTMGHQGICYGYEAFNISYKDDGLFGVYLEADEHAALGTMFNILKYLKHLCVACSDDEVLMGKNLLKSRLARKMETSLATADDIGKQMLDYGDRQSLREQFDRIDRITTDQVREVCMNNIWDRDPASAAVGRTNAHHYMNYLHIRDKLSWWRY